MIRIGFDPMLDAQQEHKNLIRQNELLRLSQDGMPRSHSGFSTSKILAFIGREFTSLGSSLESRYGAALDEQIIMDAQDSPSGCSD